MLCSIQPRDQVPTAVPASGLGEVKGQLACPLTPNNDMMGPISSPMCMRIGGENAPNPVGQELGALRCSSVLGPWKWEQGRHHRCRSWAMAGLDQRFPHWSLRSGSAKQESVKTLLGEANDGKPSFANPSTKPLKALD